MSILSLRPGRTEPPPIDPIPYAPKPKPGPHQLGSVTLAAVDQITGLSADEIDQAADRLIDAAHETADVLREAARRVRHSGLVANERLANFVRVASTCAEAAKLMQSTVEERDQPPAEPTPAPIETVPAVETALADGGTA